jgi:hypothetical protein
MGFLTGQEADWLPRATGILRDELLNIEIRVSSDGGTVRPSALAVLAFTAISNFTGT